MDRVNYFYRPLPIRGSSRIGAPSRLAGTTPLDFIEHDKASFTSP